MVLTLLAYGCPIQAIVAAFGLDERTVTSWHLKAGQHGQAVQQAVICQGQVEVGQVQGDELYIKTQYGAVWLATAMSVFSRLFIWGAVGVERNTSLVRQVVVQVRAAVPLHSPLLWVTDGFAAWADAIHQVFRDPCYTGRLGRPRLCLWPNLHLVQVVKRYTANRLTAIERRLVVGSLAAAQTMLHTTQVGLGSFNTAYIERLNATLRTWIPALTRRSRTPARHRPHLEAAIFWTGCVYNFSHLHASLDGTPAMAAGLTESVWSIRDLLFCFRFKRELLHAVL
jgi:transposase InsO family protein